MQESKTFADLLQGLSRIENAILSESFARIAPKQLCSYRDRFTLDGDSKQVLRALEHPGTTLEKRIGALFLLHEELGKPFSEIGLTRPTNGHRVCDDMSGIWIAPEN